MHRKIVPLLPLLIVCPLITLSAFALAQEKACLIEGSMTMMGKKTEMKDCMENIGIAQAQFVEACNKMGNATAGMGGPPAKVTFMAACPPQPQGACEGLFKQPLTGYYYKRGEKSLASTKTSCVAQGGKWK
jgi:hypothetical protein